MASEKFGLSYVLATVVNRAPIMFLRSDPNEMGMMRVGLLCRSCNKPYSTPAGPHAWTEKCLREGHRQFGFGGIKITYF